MRFGLWTLAAILVGAVLAHLLLQDRGYVLINFAGYSIEMSVPAMVLLLFAGYFGIRLAVFLWRAPRRLGEVVADARLRRAGTKLTRGLIHLAEGDWSKGERLLTQGLKGTDAPLINYLLAARAAQLQGSNDRRDDWLRLAYDELPEAEAAILLTQAELQLEHDEFERALATLNRIEESHPGHPLALELLIRAHGALRDYDRVIELLPGLKDARAESSGIAEIATSAFRRFGTRSDLTAEQLDAFWGRLSGALRRMPAMIGVYAEALGRLGRGDAAEKTLRQALKAEWRSELVAAYGQISASDPSKQLKRAEQWLKGHAEDAVLLLTTARLCMAVELWGKARSYLESSIALAPTAEAYALYGQLLKQLGEDDGAATAFRSGLALVTGTTGEFPALGGPVAGSARSPASKTSGASNGASRATR
jgi:HemY protein